MLEKRVPTGTPAIRITINGKPALTVDLAATRHGIDPATMRKILSRAHQPRDAELDARTPLYLAATIDKLIAARPGRGVGGGRPRKETPQR
jgi:hypothetical protein